MFTCEHLNYNFILISSVPVAIRYGMLTSLSIYATQYNQLYIMQGTN